MNTFFAPYHHLIMAALALTLSGCSPREWFSKNSCSGCEHHHHGHASSRSQTGKAMATAQGKTLLTQKSFDAQLEKYFHAQPQLRLMIDQQPAEQQRLFYEQALQSMVSDALIKKYVHEHKWDADPEFQEHARQAHEMLTMQMMHSLVQNKLMHELESELTDDEAQQFYEEQKERMGMFKREPFIEKAGGTHVKAVTGLTQAQAEALLATAQQKGLVAAAQKKKVTDYPMVSSRSFEVPEAIRREASQMQTFPAYALVKTDKSYGVIEGISAEPALYKPYSDPQIRKAVREFMLRTRLSKKLHDMLQELKHSYNVQMNPEALADYIKAADAPSELA